jgi:type IV pilus assembly protein PilM
MGKLEFVVVCLTYIPFCSKFGAWEVAMWSSKGEVVGLDIGTSCIKVVELAHTHKGYFLKTLVIEPLPAQVVTPEGIQYPDVLANTIAQIFRQHKIKNRKVAVGISGPSVSVKKITMPNAPADELPDMVRWEADQYIPFDPADAYIDFQVQPFLPDDRTLDLLLVVAKKQQVQTLVQAVQKAGLTPVIIDSNALALENQYEVNYNPSDHELVVLLDIGASIITINVLKDGSTIFVNSVLGGGNDVTRAIQQGLNTSLEEAERLKQGKGLTGVNINRLRKIAQQVSEQFANQIERLLNCFMASHPEEVVPRVLLSGGVSLFQGFSGFLAHRLGWPVDLVNPLKGIAWQGERYSSRELSRIAPQLATGVGLALRRPGDKVHKPLAGKIQGGCNGGRKK